MKGYCPNHNAYFEGVKPPFNVMLFIILICCTGVLWIVYLVIYLIQTEDRCPQCGARLIAQPIAPPQNAAPQPILPNQQQFVTQQSAPSPAIPVTTNTPKFCPSCGSPLETSASFCRACGTKILI